MRFEIQLESAAYALIGAGATDVMNYTIANPRIQTSCYQLSDLVSRSLNELSSTSGLEILAETCFLSSTIRSTNTIQLESSKACSRALGAYLKEFP
jgi:hypothetical protein